MNASLPHSEKGPALFVICSWTNARMEHVKNYSNEYRRVFPDTPILVLDTHFRDLLSPGSSTVQKQIEVAVELIHNMSSSGLGLHLHVFSEGGCFKACRLAENYRQKYGLQLPVAAMVLDSTPGKPRYLRHCKGLAKAITKNRWLQALCLPMAFAITGTVWIGYMIFTDFANNPMSWSRLALLDFKASGSDVSKPHLFYRFSTQDDIVDHHDVMEHIEQATQQGFSVEICTFNTDHVCHAKKQENRAAYWSSIHHWWLPNCPLEDVSDLTRETLIPTQYHRIWMSGS